MQYYNPVEFLKYEKISDDVLPFGKNAVIRFNVGLAKYKDDNRYFFHKEYEYSGKNHGTTSVTIRRTYDYYLTIENVSKPKDGVDKAFIRIGIREFVLFKRAVNDVVKWFTDKKYNKLFVQVDGKLTMSAPIPSRELKPLPMDRWLRFDPIILEGLDFKEPGVRVTLSDEENIVDLDLGLLMGLQDMLNSFNMLNTAQLMIAGLPTPIGTNRNRIDDGTAASYKESRQPIIASEKNIDGILGRRIGGPKLDDLEKEI